MTAIAKAAHMRNRLIVPPAPKSGHYSASRLTAGFGGGRPAQDRDGRGSRTAVYFAALLAKLAARRAQVAEQVDARDL